MEVLLNVGNGIGIVQGIGEAAVCLDYVMFEAEVCGYVMLRPDISKAKAARIIAQWYYQHHKQHDIWQHYNAFIDTLTLELCQ